MADAPIQRVTNADWFRTNRDVPTGGGAKKDFYRGDPDAFAAHQTRLASALQAIARSNASSPVVNVVVTMRPDALAKSHRPFQRLFSESRAAHVGTADYGELIFALRPTDISVVAGIVASAELEERWRVNAVGAYVFSPTAARTETSAIADVRQWKPDEERGFSLTDAESWLESHPSARMEVELLDEAELNTAPSTRRAEQDRVEVLVAQDLGQMFVLEKTQERSSTSLTGPAARTPRSRFVDSASFRRKIATLEASSAVRRLRLEDDPFGDQPADFARHPNSNADVSVSLPASAKRAVVGVIDGGILGPMANSMQVVGRASFLDPADRDLKKVTHGTGIATVVALGSAFNAEFLSPTEDCDVYDLDLFPRKEAEADYFTGVEDFFDELRESVRRAKESYGVRIFNLSYNMVAAPGNSRYSPAAEHLDRIALELDVIFVTSAGNFTEVEQRPEWPAAPEQVAGMLARFREPDGLLAPAESVANIAVGAVNPPGLEGVAGAPTRYTRRGTHTPSALKPDLAAPGGGEPEAASGKTGLRGLDAFGTVTNFFGTSFAAPIVARHLASLDHATQGTLSRELLIALSVHHARPPIALSSRHVSDLAPSFVGRGTLPTVQEVLTGAAHSMTFVLSDVMLPGRKLSMPFSWPASLTDASGKCRGGMRLTLVARPMLNFAHGAEFVRVNLDAAAKQADEEGRFKSQTAATHEFFSGYRYANERTLSTALGKWFPTKSYEARMPRGRGKSTDWRLDIDYLLRAREEIPDEGVPFAAVLTIEDLSRSAPVFEEMRASLSVVGVALSDIRTSVRVGAST